MKPSPAESAICEKCFGISKEQIVQAREYESLYQFCNRSALRKYDSESIVEVYVFDELQARSLSDNIEYIDLGLDDAGSTNIPLYLTTAQAKRYERITLEQYPTQKSFDKWLQKKTNSDLDDRKRSHFKRKYEALSNGEEVVEANE